MFTVLLRKMGPTMGSKMGYEHKYNLLSVQQVFVDIIGGVCVDITHVSLEGFCIPTNGRMSRLSVKNGKFTMSSLSRSTSSCSNASLVISPDFISCRAVIL